MRIILKILAAPFVLLLSLVLAVLTLLHSLAAGVLSILALIAAACGLLPVPSAEIRHRVSGC